MPISTQSKKRISRRRTALLMTVASSAMLALPYAARAQMVPVPAPPVEQSVDVNGVDIVLGTFNISSTDLSIGPAGAQGMVYARESRGAGWRDNLAATISTSGTTVMVSIGGSSDSFTQSGSTFTSTQGNGATLVLAGDYIYTSADGTVVRFAPASGDYDRFVSNMGWALSIEFANGARWDFTYADKLYCPQVLAGGQTCAVPLKRSVRLQSVTNSFRYQLKLQYGSNTLTHMGELEAWHRLAKVTGINNTVESCAPAADSCTLSNPWPFVTYDASGQTVTHSAGTVKRFTKGANGITSIKRPGSATDTVTIAYGADGKVSQVINEGVVWNYAWNEDETGISGGVHITGPLGASRTIISDLLNSVVELSIDALSRNTRYEYDAQTRLTRVISPEGNATAYAYDSRGNVVTTTRSPKPGSPLANIITSATFPATCTNPKTCNKPLTTTNALARVTNYEYDPGHGGITSVTAPAPTTGAVRPQTRYGYSVLNGVSLLTSTSTCQTLASCTGTADEVKTAIAYGAVSSNLLPVSVSNGAGNGALTASVSVGYDIFGNRMSVDGPLPGTADTITTRYDALRRVVGVITPDPDGAGPRKRAAQRTVYNADGQPTYAEVGTVNGTSEADWAGLVSAQQVFTYYDANARVSRESVTAAGVNYAVTDYTYDALGRTDCVAQRMNPAVWGTQIWACYGQTPGASGPDRITRFVYNEVGQVREVQSALGTPDQQNVVQSYNPNGTVTSLNDARDNRTTYEYDGFDRLAKTRFPLAATGWVSSTTDFEALTYDVNGNVIQRRVRDGQVISYAYDTLNRLIFKDVPADAYENRDVSYTYDLLGRLKSATKADGFASSFTYDALGRKRSEGNGFGVIFYQYDLGGRVTQLTHGDGFFVTYDYDTLGKMLAIRESGSALLATYAYDDLGRRTSLTRGNGTVTSYAYDPVSRLASLSQDFAGTMQDVTSSFTYNTASQIATRSRNNDLYAWTWPQGSTGFTRPYTNNGLNQHVSVGGGAYAYDGRGNLTGDGTKSYLYTSENRLIGTPGVTLFGYDALGQLAAIFTNKADYLMMADGLPQFEFNSVTGLLRRHVHGPGSDTPLLTYEGAGLSDKRYLHADERGSIIAISNVSGAVTQINAYDDYGIPQGKMPAGTIMTDGTGLATTNFGRFGYTGQAWLPEIGLNYYKNRMYSPTLGRFMQADPIGYADGVNLYAYVGGDPINKRDPLGLATTGNNNETDELVDAPDIIVSAKRIARGDGDNINLRALFDDLSSIPPLFGNGRQDGVSRLDQEENLIDLINRAIIAGFKTINEIRKEHNRFVQCVVTDNIARGNEVQTEVTFDFRGETARFDIVVNLPSGSKEVIEVKTTAELLDPKASPSSLLVRNQLNVSLGISGGGAIPRGNNAIAAGFAVGIPLSSTKFGVQAFVRGQQC